MPSTTFSIKLVDGTTVTLTQSSINNFPDARAAAAQIGINNGFFDDSGAWHPATAILTVSIQVS